jgi:Rieske Fe-S protein
MAQPGLAILRIPPHGKRATKAIEEDVLAEKRLSRRKFIKIGVAVGIGTTGASVLAACGGGSGSEGPGEEAVEGGLTGGVQGAAQSAGGTTTQSGGTPVAEIPEGAPIARVADVPRGSAVEFTDAQLQQPAVLVHLEDGDFAAYSAVCTHRGCTVNYRDGKLACPCHGSVFDPARDAAVEAGPAPRPLPEIPVEVRGNEVLRA